MEQSYPNSNPQMISSGSSVYLDFRYAHGFALPNVYIYIYKCVGPYTTEPLFFFFFGDGRIPATIATTCLTCYPRRKIYVKKKQKNVSPLKRRSRQSHRSYEEFSAKKK